MSVDQIDRPGFISPGIGQELAPWRQSQVAVASSGLFPQPLLIKRCSEAQRETDSTESPPGLSRTTSGRLERGGGWYLSAGVLSYE